MHAHPMTHQQRYQHSEAQLDHERHNVQMYARCQPVSPCQRDARAPHVPAALDDPKSASQDSMGGTRNTASRLVTTVRKNRSTCTQSVTSHTRQQQRERVVATRLHESVSETPTSAIILCTRTCCVSTTAEEMVVGMVKNTCRPLRNSGLPGKVTRRVKGTPMHVVVNNMLCGHNDHVEDAAVCVCTHR